MRRIAKLAVVLAAAGPLVAAHTAQAAAPCVTPAEFSSLVQFALPSIVDGARLRCQNSVPATAFLRTGTVGMAQKFRQGSAQAWPQARAAFLKIGNTGKDSDLLLASLPDEGLRSTIETIVQGLVISQLPLDACGKVDRLLTDLAPLPARNTADLVSLLIETGSDKKGGKAGPLTICPTRP